MSGPVKVALVTGASEGIGRAIAETLRDEGWRVLAAQRREAEGFESIAADLSKPDAAERTIAEAVRRAGALDLLVNNAGFMREGTAEETTIEAFERMVRVNLVAPFALIKHAMPHLAARGGTIVNVGSIEGLAANPRHPAYAASKAGLHGLTRAVAVDAGERGVRCNAVAPGWIDTALSRDYAASMPDPEAFAARLAAIHPIGRTGTPEDVAAAVAWLAGGGSAFVTGQVIVVDGGRLARPSLPWGGAS